MTEIPRECLGLIGPDDGMAPELVLDCLGEVNTTKFGAWCGTCCRCASALEICKSALRQVRLASKRQVHQQEQVHQRSSAIWSGLPCRRAVSGSASHGKRVPDGSHQGLKGNAGVMHSTCLVHVDTVGWWCITFASFVNVAAGCAAQLF